MSTEGAIAPFEEAFEAPGVPRELYAGVMEALAQWDLDDLEQRVDDHLAGHGVTFGSQPFVIDPVPRLLEAGVWAGLEAGLAQRVRALNEFVRDVYGERRIVSAGVMPADVIDEAKYYEPELRGAPLGRTPIVVAGLDVVRDGDGGFLLLEDNVRTPSGVAYAIAAREAVAAHLDVPPAVVPIGGAYDLLGDALRAAAPDGVADPFVVVLTDGPSNTAFYEHRRIAQRLGLPLVALGDLSSGEEGVFVRHEGQTRRVDVVYRRTDEDRLTTPEGTPTAVGELLLEPLRAGTVAVANSFGTGVADDKRTHAYVEDMIRFYLGQEPMIPSVPTFDLADEELREPLLDTIDELVVKPREGSGGHGILIGPHARREDRDAMADAVRESPADYVAQRTVWLSTHPTVVRGGLEPRHVDLRAFVFLAGDEARVMPGGLTRVARDPGALVVNSSQDGGAKDTWVVG